LNVILKREKGRKSQRKPNPDRLLTAYASDGRLASIPIGPSKNQFGKGCKGFGPGMGRPSLSKEAAREEEDASKCASKARQVDLTSAIQKGKKLRKKKKNCNTRMVRQTQTRKNAEKKGGERGESSRFRRKSVQPKQSMGRKGKGTPVGNETKVYAPPNRRSQQLVPRGRRRLD